MEYDIKTLKVNLQKSTKDSGSYPKRLGNIKWIEELNRTDLTYGDKEKQILIVTPDPSTEILIQYPGKESAPNPENPDKIRPWDFRPKILNKDTADYQADLAFDTLWRELEQKLTPLKDKDALRVLAIVLYRMAFMIDHCQTAESELKVKYLDGGRIIREATEGGFKPRLKYSPPKEAVQYLSNHIPKICGMSCEVFLYYIELLTWNEDCKYYYANIKKTEARPPRQDGQERTVPWLNDTGRVNTLLTIINFIGILLGEVKMSALFSKFAFYGVAGVTDDDISRICKGCIVQNNGC